MKNTLLLIDQSPFQKYISLLVLTLLINGIELFAQANTIVMGRIDNVNLVREIDLEVNEKFIDNQIKTYSSKVLDDNTFAFAAEIRVPQIVALIYSRNKAYIYLEPNDTLYIEAEANSFQYSLKFSGKSGANNTFYQKYRKENPVERNQFLYTNYRHGNFWYNNPPQMDLTMQKLPREQFVSKMLMEREKALTEMNAFEYNSPYLFTPMFKEFMRAEIEYKWAFNILMYGNVFTKKHKLESDYYEYLYEIPLYNNQIGNLNYRMYVSAYMNHLFLIQNEGKVMNSYAGQYDLAVTQLEEKPRAFFQAEIIERAFRKPSAVSGIMPKYEDYLRTNPYIEFDEKIVQAYQKAMKYAIGSNAPNFTLTTLDGRAVSLSDYYGKVVFLNFWANWCRPCIKKMNDMKGIQRELEQQGIVFLNISFDKTEEAWRNGVVQNGFVGTHILAQNGVDSSIAQEYNIQALPQYFIIDKWGRFARKPKTNKLYDLRLTLQQLNRAN